MKHVDYLLIGGGVASARAAGAIRERDSNGTIILAAGESVAPYDRPPLSKELLRGEVKAPDIRSEKRSFYRRHRTRLLKNTTISELHLDSSPHIARTSDGKEIAFGKALLATGGTPRTLSVPGSDLRRIHTLRSMDDSLAIAAEARRRAGARVVVIGAGFIGLEIAASLTQLGAAVTVVELQDQVWGGFAPARLAEIIRGEMESRGVSLRFSSGVVGFGSAGGNDVSSVELTDGSALQCDFAVVAVGIDPNVVLARSAGVAVDDGVVVDERLVSSHPDLFAAGDVASVLDPAASATDPASSSHRRIEHFGQAEYTGSLAGTNMAGGEQSYNLVPYVWSDIFDLHLDSAGDPLTVDRVVERSTGANEDELLLVGLRDERVTAFWSLNTDESVYAPVRMLIRRKTPIASPERIADPGIDLASLLNG